NIINLGKSDPVDPEDWSPQRTQSVDPLQPGESAEQSWSVEAVLDGNYMVYLTAIVKPGTPEQTTLPITSPGIHLTVAAFQDTNPSGVLPVAIGMPIGLIVVATMALLLAMGMVTACSGTTLVPITPPPATPTPEPTPTPGPATPTPGPVESGQPTPTAAPSPVELALSIDTAKGADDFHYATDTLSAPAGAKITLTFSNKTNPDDEVGHNWVLVKPGHEDSVLASANAAGDDRDWLDKEDPGI